MEQQIHDALYAFLESNSFDFEALKKVLKKIDSDEMHQSLDPLKQIDINRVFNDWSTLEHVKDQDEVICLIAVNRSGYAVQFVKEQTPIICLAAIMRIPMAYQYIDDNIPNQLIPSNPTHQRLINLGWRDGYLDKIKLIAVSNNGVVLRSIKDQTPTICLSAVNQNPVAMRYVKDLASIADSLEQSTINEGLNFIDKELSNAYQKLVKIREANAIVKRINACTGLNNQSNKPKVKL